jgi:hypothetical protein
LVARSSSCLVESDANVLAGRRSVDGLNDQAVLVDQYVPAGYKFGTLENKKTKLSIVGDLENRCTVLFDLKAVSIFLSCKLKDKVLVKTDMNIKCLVLLYSI